MNKIYQPIYMAVINLSGLYSKKPIKLIWNKDRNQYENSNGDWSFKPSIDPIGFSTSSRIVQYVSYNKSDVELWLCGASAAISQIRSWCS